MQQRFRRPNDHSFVKSNLYSLISRVVLLERHYVDGHVPPYNL